MLIKNKIKIDNEIDATNIQKLPSYNSDTKFKNLHNTSKYT